MPPRWKQAPAGSHWGEFGPDDQRGRMNMVTPAKVRQGIAEVREGRTFCLSLPLDVPGGQALNPRRTPEAAPHRVVWGSDWPHTRPGAARPRTEGLLALARAWTEPGLRERLFHRNAIDLYRFPSAQEAA